MGHLLIFPLSPFQRQIQVNLLSAVRLTQLTLPHMLERKTGLVVNIASVMGRFTMPNVIAYGTSKHALIGFGEGLRRELRGTGVSTLNVIGGFVDSGLLSAETLSAIRRSPMKIVTSELLVKRTLKAIQSGKAQVYTHWFDQVMGWIGHMAPRLSDTLYILLAPTDMPDAALTQHTE